MQKEITYTKHGKKRRDQRGFLDKHICQTIDFGRVTYRHGARIFSVGKKEVVAFKAFQNIDLTPIEGIHVICSNDDFSIITVYRNHNFSSIKKKGKCRQTGR